MNAQQIVVDFFGTAITYIAAAVVWLTLVAGMYQLIRARVHEVSEALSHVRAGGHMSRRFIPTSTDKPGKVTQHV